jgi:hypothetical protein
MVGILNLHRYVVDVNLKEGAIMSGEKSNDGQVEDFSFSRDDKDGSYRQDRVEGTKSSHEHTWSKTSTDGCHKEGWHGDGFKTRHNKG